MGYIVDLIMVVQLLFSVVASNQLPITRRLINITIKAYNDSIVKAQVHIDIQDHVNKAGVFNHAKDVTFSKIVDLIESHDGNTSQMLGLMGKTLEMLREKNESLGDDDEWDIPMSKTRG
jgi:hypothetical protein